MPVFGVGTKALLTRSPLIIIGIATNNDPFDLHALSTPPAFILSQDQTLLKNSERLTTEAARHKLFDLVNDKKLCLLSLQ